MLASPKMPLNTPLMRPRSAGGKSLRDHREDGRGQDSAGQALHSAEDDQLGHVLARPHSADVSTNSAELPIKNILRPYRSESLP